MTKKIFDLGSESNMLRAILKFDVAAALLNPADKTPFDYMAEHVLLKGKVFEARKSGQTAKGRERFIEATVAQSQKPQGTSALAG